MMDFSPRPAGSSRARQIWAHAMMEAGLILRNGEQLILSVVFPLAMLIGGRYLGEKFGLDFQELAPSVLGMVAWSSGLTALAISTGFERRYNVLERLTATPLGKDGILAGKAISIALITLGQVLGIVVIALALGWSPKAQLGATLVTALVFVSSLAAFIGLGLAMAGSLRPETTLALANLVFLIGLPLGIVLPVSVFPGWAQLPISGLPTAALGESLRAGSAGSVLWWPVLVSALWCALAWLLARKVFKWTS